MLFCLQVNSKEICKEGKLYFRKKNNDVSFFLRFKANYLRKMRGYFQS